MSIRALASAGALVAVGMMCSRLLGFLREALVAATHGVGADASMAIGMLTIPDYIIGLFIGGTLSAALLPAFAKRNEQDRLALFWQFLVVNIIVFGTVALLLYTQSSSIITLFHNDINAVPDIAIFWALMSMPLAVAAGVSASWLQYHQRYKALAFGHVVFNAVVVLGLWLLPVSFIYLGLAIFTGAVMRLLLLVVGFFKNEGKLYQGGRWQINKSLMRHYFAAIGNSFFSTLPVYVPYFLLPLLDGRLPLYNYSVKLIYLPAMILSTIVNMVLLPRYVHARQANQGADEYRYSLTIMGLVSFAVALCMALAAQQIVTLCFGYGKMTLQDIEQVSRLFTIGIISLPFMVVSYIWQQIFYAHEESGVPFKVGLLQTLLCVPFMWVGYAFGKESGVMVAIIGLQIVPLMLFSNIAHKRSILARTEQYRGLVRMLAAGFVVYVAMVFIYQYMELSLVPSVIFSIVTGLVMVTAGMGANVDIRNWFLSVVKRT